MKLCQKCYVDIGIAGYGIEKRNGIVFANPFLVPESDCEFPAHLEARKLYAALVVATKE